MLAVAGPWAPHPLSPPFANSVEEDVAQLLALKVASQVADDVGPCVADGQTLRHRFTVKNPTGDAIRLTDAVASTSCCSSIGPLPRSIPAHGVAEVPVEFRPGFQAGRKRVRFVVATDRAECPRIELFLTADLHPSWEVAPVEGSAPSSPIGVPLDRPYRIITRRQGTEGRSPVARLEIAGPFTARFGDNSRPVERRLPGAIIESEQTCRVEAPARAEAGTVAADLRLAWADGTAQTYPIRWEVASPVRLSPPTVVIAAGDPPQPTALVVQSNDRPIRITGVVGDCLARPVELPREPAPIHRLDLTVDPARTANQRPEVEVRTDHPSQPLLRLKLLVVPSRSEVNP